MPRAINGWVSKGKVVFSYRDANGKLQFKQNAPCDYAAFTAEPPGREDYRITGYNKVGDFYRVTFRDYKMREQWIQTHDCMEGDVSPVRRLMADYDIDIQAPKRCFLDLETDPRVPFVRKEETRILTWSVRGADGKRTRGALARDSDDAEKTLIMDLFTALLNYDQVAAWNGDAFDFPVLKARCEYHRIWWDRRLLWIDQMVAFKRMNLQVAESGEEKQSFSLEAVAMSKLGVGKEEIPEWVAKRWPNRPLASLGWELWSMGGLGLELLLKYNETDTERQAGIEAATGYLDALQTICNECHIFADSHALKPTAQLDGWMLRYARMNGKRLPTRIERETQPQFEGAYVMPPIESGILKDVHVLDFAGLYPSIIRTWNISYDTKTVPDDPERCNAPGTGIAFRTDFVGMIPSALAEFAKLRTAPKAEMKKCHPGSPEWHVANRLQNVFKTLANSVYGLLGSIWSRYYDPDLARSVTLTGVWLLKLAMEEAAKFGYRAIYADTDGCYLVGLTSEQAGAFTKHFNEVVVPAKLKEQGCVTQIVKLDYQEAFSRLVFPLGDDGKPSAKRFCGRFSVYDGAPVTKRSVEIKGLEVKRGDTSRLARGLQQEVIDLLMNECEDPQVFEDLVARWRKRITLEPLDVADIAISKSVKELGSYAIRRRKDGSEMSQPAHVEIAKRMAAKGQDVSSGVRVSYVVTDADVSPQEIIALEDYVGGVDVRHMWHATYDPTLRLLAGAFDSRNWNRWKIPKVKVKNRPLKGQLGLGL